ncbi:unnamed protein product [Prunus armeniaca]
MSESFGKESQDSPAFGGEETESDECSLSIGSKDESTESEHVVEGVIESMMVGIVLEAIVDRVLALPHTLEVGSSNRAGPSGSADVVVAFTSVGLEVQVGVPLPKKNKMTDEEIVELRANYSIPPLVGLRLPTATDVVRYLANVSRQQGNFGWVQANCQKPGEIGYFIGLASVVKGTTKVVVQIDEAENQRWLRVRREKEKVARAKKSDKGDAERAARKRPSDDEKGLGIVDGTCVGGKKALLKVISIPWMRQGFAFGTLKLGPYYVVLRVPSAEFFYGQQDLAHPISKFEGVRHHARVIVFGTVLLIGKVAHVGPITKLVHEVQVQGQLLVDCFSFICECSVGGLADLYWNNNFVIKRKGEMHFACRNTEDGVVRP